LERSHHSYAKGVLSARYIFDEEEHVSIEVAYTKGRESPKFERVEQTALTIGIKF